MRIPPAPLKPERGDLSDLADQDGVSRQHSRLFGLTDSTQGG
jgi:hypothetical protein